MKNVSSWPWPEISRECLHRSNLLRKADGIAKLNLAGDGYRLQFPAVFQAPFNPAVEISVLLGGMRILIESESIPRKEPMYSLLEGLEDGDLPPEALGAILESSFETILAGAEKLFGAPLAIEHIRAMGGAPRAEVPTVDVFLEPEPASAAEPIRIRIRLEDQVLETLLGRLTPLPTDAGPDMGHVPVMVTFTAAEAKLRVAEFADLECGDVILIDADPRLKNGIKVRAGGAARACALATWEGRDLILEESMAMEGNKDGAHDNTGKHPLEELDVDIAFELGRRLIPIRELGELKAGHIFLLPENPEGLVDIRVHGITLGKGTLVKVSGHVGIRVESLRGKESDKRGVHAVEPGVPEAEAAPAEAGTVESGPVTAEAGTNMDQAVTAGADHHDHP